MNRLGTSLCIGWMVASAISLSAQAGTDTFPHAHAHYNFILEAYNEVGDAADAYLAYSVHSDDSSSIAERQEALQETIASVRNRVVARPGYQGDRRVRDGLLSLLDMYDEVFQDRVFTAETLGEREAKYARQEIQFAWQAQAEEKMAQARTDFLIHRMHFAKDHEIKRRTLPLQFVHKRINELMDYCQTIEWARVRIVRQHAAFLDAMEARDSTQMKQRRWDLLLAASQAHNEIADMPNFYGEFAYREAAKDLFSFYRNLAARDLSSWITLVALGDGSTRAADPEDPAESARLEAYTRAIEQRNASVARYNRHMPPLRDAYFNKRKMLQRKYVPRNLGKE